MLRFLLGAIVAGSVFGTPGRAEAGFLTTHAKITTSLGGGDSVTAIGDGPLDSGLRMQSEGGPSAGVGAASSAARAIANTTTDGLLKAFGTAYSEAGGFNPSGAGAGLAAWRDIAFVDSLTAPATLRLTFRVEGTLTAASEIPFTTAYLGVSTTTNPVNFFQTSQGSDLSNNSGNIPLQASYHPTGQSSNYPSGYGTQGPWDSAVFTGGTFVGVFHIDTPYNASLGGYGWGVAFQVGAYAKFGIAEANSLNSMDLQAVTLTDGTPVAVTFDSGLQFGPAVSPVPAPSSVVLLGSGAISLLAVWRRRRAEPGAAADGGA